MRNYECWNSTTISFSSISIEIVLQDGAGTWRHGYASASFFTFLSLLIRPSYQFYNYNREDFLLYRTSVGELNSDVSARLNLIESMISEATQDENEARQQTTRKGRRRGKRGGALVRLRNRKHRPPLPSIYLANVRSLRYKMDELNCNIATRKDFRDCCVFCFTETWLDDSVPDQAVIPPGFSLFRSDRDYANVDKASGGGL